MKCLIPPPCSTGGQGVQVFPYIKIWSKTTIILQILPEIILYFNPHIADWLSYLHFKSTLILRNQYFFRIAIRARKIFEFVTGQSGCPESSFGMKIHSAMRQSSSAYYKFQTLFLSSLIIHRNILYLLKHIRLLLRLLFFFHPYIRPFLVLLSVRKEHRLNGYGCMLA